MLQCSVGEISSLSLFFAEVEIIPKGEEKRFLHVSFLCHVLYPENTRNYIPVYGSMQRQHSSAHSSRIMLRIGTWGGKTTPGEGWGNVLHCLRQAKHSQLLQNQFPPLLVCCHSVAQDGLSRVFREFLWRCLSHSRELCNKNHPHFPLQTLCMCETHEINSGDSHLLIIPDSHRNGSWAPPLRCFRTWSSEKLLAGQVLMAMWFGGKRKSIFSSNTILNWLSLSDFQWSKGHWLSPMTPFHSTTACGILVIGNCGELHKSCCSGPKIVSQEVIPAKELVLLSHRLWPQSAVECHEL